MRSKLAAIGGLFKAAVVNWVDDYAQSMGAARNAPGHTAIASAPAVLLRRAMGRSRYHVASALIVLALAAAARAQPPLAQPPAPPKGLSIPQIDLAADTARQTVVDREPGQYLGHPTTVLLEDGRTIIAVYPKGHGRGAIVMKRSTDGGRTWSARLPTPPSWDTSLEVPTMYRVVDSKGEKRLIVFSGLYPIRLAVSEDDGATWSGLAPIGNFGGIVAMASPCRRCMVARAMRAPG